MYAHNATHQVASVYIYMYTYTHICSFPCQHADIMATCRIVVKPLSTSKARKKTFLEFQEPCDKPFCNLERPSKAPNVGARAITNVTCQASIVDTSMFKAIYKTLCYRPFRGRGAVAFEATEATCAWAASPQRQSSSRVSFFFFLPFFFFFFLLLLSLLLLLLLLSLFSVLLFVS